MDPAHSALIWAKFLCGEPGSENYGTGGVENLMKFGKMTALSGKINFDKKSWIYDCFL